MTKRPETLYCTVEREELKRLREDAEKLRKLRTFVFIYLDSSGAEYVAIDLPRVGSSDFIRINELDLALDAALLDAQGERHE